MENKYHDNNPSKNLLAKLRTGFLEKERYITTVISIPRPSHDLFPLIEYENKKGILLIKRKIEPAKGMIWCLGGKHERGYFIRDSLTELIKNECNLNIYDLFCLSGEPQDIFWEEDSFGHGKGTHDSCIPYFARAEGKLKLDKLHSTPLIITQEYFSKIKDDLHWYIRENTEKALNLAFR